MINALLGIKTAFATYTWNYGTTTLTFFGNDGSTGYGTSTGITAIIYPLLASAKDLLISVLGVVVPITLGLIALGWILSKVYGLVRGR